MNAWSMAAKTGNSANVLQHAGITGICIRHRAIVVHLEHDRGYVNAPAMARNRQIWNTTRSSRLTWTEHGILQPTQSS